jgi:CRISPR system Cascade subunit CasD
MSTLLFRLDGPMQSWGTQSRFRERDTGLEPSKSGVVGLLCAALGWTRDVDLSPFARLTMGVRVNREGFMRRDYHTAGGGRINGRPYGVIRASGKLGGTVLSNRYYLADADFLVGLNGDESFLRDLDAALQYPHWQLFLGRKSFLPGAPVRLLDGLKLGVELQDALKKYPWFARSNDEREQKRDEITRRNEAGDPVQLRVVRDDSYYTSGEVRQDEPLSFAERKFTLRYVRTDFVPLTEQMVEVNPLCISPS